MTSRARELDDIPLSVQIMLASRPTFFLSGRAIARIWQVVSPNGAGRGPRRAALAAFCLGADVALARWMATTGSSSTRIGARLLLDVVDSAVWSAMAPDSDEATIIPMVTAAPLAAEAGFVLRWRGLVCACAAPAAALLVRAARRQPLRCSQVVWPVASALPGPLVRLIDDWLLERIDAAEGQIVARINEERRRESARITLSADPVVDELRDVGRKLQLATDTVTGWEQLAAYKQQLTEWATGDGRAFLGSELLSREADQLSHDVQQRLTFRLKGGSALMVLDPDQRDALRALLSAARLSGDVAVAVVRPSRAGVRSTDAMVAFDDVAVSLPGPTPMTVREFDGTAIVQSITAAFMLMPMFDDNGGARWWSCLPPAAAAASHAVWAARTSPSYSAEGRRRSFRYAALVQLAHTALLSDALRSTHNAQGLVRFPCRFGLFGLMMMAGGQIRAVSGTDRRRVVGLTGLACAAAWVAAPQPRQMTTWTTDVLGALPGVGVMVGIKQATDLLMGEWALDTAHVRAAVEDQRRRACEQLEEWHHRLADLVSSTDMPDDLRAEFAERLRLTRLRIELLRTGGPDERPVDSV